MLRLLVLLMILPQVAIAAPWAIVPSETRIEVDVGWLGRSITLRFEDVAGRIEFDERRPERAHARIAVDAAAVETGVGVINAFVRGREWLNVRTYPQIGFELDRLVRTSESTADVFGRITLFDVTQPVRLQASVFRYGPNAQDPQRFDAGFNIAGRIDRRQFGHTTGIPEVAAILPVRIRLLMRSQPG